MKTKYWTIIYIIFFMSLIFSTLGDYYLIKEVSLLNYLFVNMFEHGIFLLGFIGGMLYYSIYGVKE